jgi:hypothetical protein
MEMPDVHLPELSKHTDFDFCLAHRILEQGRSGVYPKFYKKQAEQGREVWMDNSFHELGHALPLEDLLTAAKIVNPTHIVAFEVAKDPLLTHTHVVEMIRVIKAKKLPYKVVASWQGSKKALTRLEEIADLVALPFRRPRQNVLDPDNCGKYHYFGIRTLDEIRRLPPRSIDTSAPIKYALHGVDMTTRERRLRTPPLDYDATYADSLLDRVVANIHLMHEAAKGKA